MDWQDNIPAISELLALNAVIRGSVRSSEAISSFPHSEPVHIFVNTKEQIRGSERKCDANSEIHIKMQVNCAA
jgi:hypothetical protein